MPGNPASMRTNYDLRPKNRVFQNRPPFSQGAVDPKLIVNMPNIDVSYLRRYQCVGSSFQDKALTQ